MTWKFHPLRPRWKAVSAVAFLQFLGAACECFGLLVLWKALGSLDSKSDLDVSSQVSIHPSLPTLSLNSWFFMFFGAVIAGVIFRFVAQRQLIKCRVECETESRNLTLDSLNRIDWLKFVGMRSADFEKAIVSEGFYISAMVFAYLSCAGFVGATMVYLIASAIVSFKLSLVCLSFGLVMFVVYRLVSNQLRKHAEQLSPAVTEVTAKIGTYLGALKFYRATGTTEIPTGGLKKFFKWYQGVFYRSEICHPSLSAITEILGVVFLASVLGVSVGVFKNDLVTSLVFLGIFYRLVPRLMSVQSSLLQIKTFESYLKSWRDRISLSKDFAAKTGGTKVPTFEKEICFDGISFSFPERSVIVFDQFSETIQANELTVLSGSSGSGKSTLLSLLFGLFQPSSGKISIDGADLAEVDLQKWRDGLGVVTQEAPLIEGSVRENIEWGQPGDPELLKSVIESAALTDLIDRLPNGIETSVGDSGGLFSGGERQRIAIARALYRKPQVLILDEPTSALDAESEKHICDVLSKIKDQVTILAVTHRPMITSVADRVINLENRITKQMEPTNS